MADKDVVRISLRLNMQNEQHQRIYRVLASLDKDIHKSANQFYAGETLHNLNGNDYHVLAPLSPNNLLLVGLTDRQIIVGMGVQFYERYERGVQELDI